MLEAILMEIRNHIGEILVALGVGAVVIWRLVAPAIGRYISAKLDVRANEVRQELDEKRKDDEIKYKAELAEIKSRQERDHATSQSVEKLANSLERTVDAFVDHMTKSLIESRAHTNAITGNAEAVAGNTEAIGRLDTRIGNVEREVILVKDTVQALRDLIQERFPDPAECIDVEEQLAKFQETMISLIKRDTTESNLIDATTPPAPPLEGAA